MKNQYFGDRRDLFKYDLLADLAGCLPDSRLVFIPMLTPNDDSGEGGLTGYSRGERRGPLVDALRDAVASGTRNIQILRSCASRHPSRSDQSRHTRKRLDLAASLGKLAVGLSAAKALSRCIGIPLTKSGRQRKLGAMISVGGCVVVLLSVVGIPAARAVLLVVWR